MSLEPPFHIISDTHFLHENIIKYCGRPKDHNERMVMNWYSTVKEDDIVLHLGDLVLGPRGGEECTEKFLRYSSRLTGKKYLIRGNHDKQSSSWYAEHGFEVIEPFSASYRGWRISFSHRPLVLTYPDEINVHGHVHNSSFDGVTSRHVNLSVEVIDYTPVLFTKKLDHRIDTQLGGDRE